MSRLDDVTGSVIDEVGGRLGRVVADPESSDALLGVAPILDDLAV